MISFFLATYTSLAFLSYMQRQYTRNGVGRPQALPMAAGRI